MTTAEMTAADLRRYGEDEAAAWVLRCSDEELERVFQVAGYLYGRVNPLARACATAAVYVCEGVPRELRRTRRKPQTEPEGPLLRNGRYSSLAVRRQIDALPRYGIGPDLVAFFDDGAAGPPVAEPEPARAVGASWRRPDFAERDDRRAQWTTWIPDDLEERVRWSVRRIGAEDAILPHTFYSVFPLAPDAAVTEEPTSLEFLQAAGTDDRLVVEIKRREPDGALRQYVIGRLAAAAETETETVVQGEFEHRVRPAEVHATADAEELFVHYLRHRDAPAGSHLRELSEFSSPRSMRGWQ
ncbi:hypothetical protein ACLQ3K_05355 [Tsukamurella sp. DT100]|uniref:hypothetical protein n=1 Tax=Tsukamurella sp. DT100 TaxID=3393415 RepID=UPI003CF71048